MKNLSNSEKRDNLITFLTALIKDGIHFDYVDSSKWNNDKSDLGKPVTENLLGVSYPATLVVFQRENIDYKLDDIERFVISKAYLDVRPILDLLKGRNEVVRQCGWYGIKSLHVVLVNPSSIGDKEVVVSSSAPYIKYTFMPVEKFFNEGLRFLYDRDTLFIFWNVPWTFLKFKFQYHGKILTGGSHTKRELLSPLEWRLANYVTYILNVSMGHENHFINLYERERKEYQWRINFRANHRKLIHIIMSNYDLFKEMKNLGNYNIEGLFSEHVKLIDSKVRWEIIFNKLFDVRLYSGYISITVKEDQKEVVYKMINNLIEGKMLVKDKPRNIKGVKKSITPFQNKRNYSSSREVALFKYQNEKDFFDKMSKYKHAKDLRK
uniref:Uncharacterized protein n=1 Tax=Ganoderma calidophilum TaxID=2026244 RepID=A0A2S1WBM1_9APHY|nr:hypothetical protein [Ganoderma calidophilum]AWJ64000.1 hypothetical protein [Ganoderma calidophilum]